MSSVVKKLAKKELIRPPSWMSDNICYECIMGSVAYGVSSDTSDVDLYGFCIPHKNVVFPHLAGEILEFGRQKKRFKQYQQHGVVDKQAAGGKGKEYDITIYNIVKYFQLCMECNPNMIDSLFVPFECVLHTTQIGNVVRENRRLFLHKGAWFKFKGYSYSQMHKMKNKNPEGKRKELVEKYGYDTKFATHVVRLLGEIEQILIEGDLNLRRNREQLKSIRRGEWSESDIVQYFTTKERELEKLYTESKLPHSPDEGKIKELLLNCLEEHYGSIDNCISIPDKSTEAIQQIKEIVDRF